jgi:hypothetical protein
VGLCGAILLVPVVATATIEEQRRRLPPPAECEDPIEGVWKSHKYNPQFGDWEVFTLVIIRVAGSPNELEGSLTNHSWSGGPRDEEPPVCGIGMEWIVAMDGRGTVTDDLQLRFGGVGQWRLDRIICNRGPGGYNLDQFSGRVDPTIHEFQSVNNDGGRAVNIPTVFRRIRCNSPGSSQSPDVETVPPPFYPERRGCSPF